MKLYNIIVENETHLALETERGIVDATAAGFPYDMDAVIAGADMAALRTIAADSTLPVVDAPVIGNVVNKIGKLVCVGLNYKNHAQGIKMQLPEYPILFSKFDNALVPTNTPVELPKWESTYDYEAELVIVIGKETWNVSREEALGHVFGYTCGNDFSLRDAQMRSGQWLIGKTMPGFGPCGPCITTANGYDVAAGKSVRSYVNGKLRQDGSTADMIFPVEEIISYASKYIKLVPGDLIFTGTPSGVALEDGEDVRKWLVPGDRVDIVIEGIGTLTNEMV